MRIALTALALLSLPVSSFAGPQPGAVKGIVCDQAYRCTVLGSPGGVKKDYLALARAIRAHRGTLAVRGFCASACAILADALRDRTCVARGSWFAFHRAMVTAQAAYSDGSLSAPRVVGTRPNAYSRGIATWIDAHGGEPAAVRFRDALRMPYGAALRFYRPCR